ncbi:hypothetical protein HNQ51_002466 [Inhella inkyongensis]|uniref:DUF1579 domain-containing protein n=1 Tax=Inhella inkyongensis TaxID=392593 RepID=A0A840S1W2_9BURK|nr:hypothetical protein [Inhella inkyongensis]MBB5205147.1 hypothetical protein [Inhella inkyongensis]
MQHLLKRRLLLQAAATGLSAGSAAAATATATPTPPSFPPGQPGEFDFLAGEWRMHNRRLKAPGEWDEFPGEATVHRLLDGKASLEELRIPARGFAGLGLRILNLETHTWMDFWVSARNGVLSGPGMPGHFKDGVGLFEADDEDKGQPIKIRSIWDQITPKSCRWHQTVSRDGGKSWEPNWFMDWKRV